MTLVSCAHVDIKCVFAVSATVRNVILISFLTILHKIFTLLIVTKWLNIVVYIFVIIHAKCDWLKNKDKTNLEFELRKVKQTVLPTQHLKHQTAIKIVHIKLQCRARNNNKEISFLLLPILLLELVGYIFRFTQYNLKSRFFNNFVSRLTTRCLILRRSFFLSGTWQHFH